MSAAILQLSPPIHVMTPLGEAFARLVIDYGPDLNSVWVVDLFKNRACVANGNGVSAYPDWH